LRRSVGSAYLASEVIVAAETQLPDLVCIISIPPGGLAQARYICKRIRAKLPDTQILVIRPESRQTDRRARKS